MRYRAISVYQPWPQLILEGLKTMEIRSRPINYRGPILICSSLKELVSSNLPKGKAICLADIVDCRPMSPNDVEKAYYPCRKGSWAWVLANPRPVPNLSIKGRQGIFFVDAEF